MHDLNISLFEMARCLSKALDLVDRKLTNHHERVGLIAFHLARELAFSPEEQSTVFLAGLLHDSGGISLDERLGALQFDAPPDFHRHAETGYRLLKNFSIDGFEPLAEIAEIVRYHHAPWRDDRLNEIPFASNVLNLADRLAVLIGDQREVLGQVPGILDQVKELSGETFASEAVEALLRLAKREAFWLEVSEPRIAPFSQDHHWRLTDIAGLQGMGKLFAKVIDFRSRFTATHTSGVATSAEALGRFCRMSEEDCGLMKVAGYFHDLGKLVVPPKILEKPSALSNAEFSVIRSHTFHTHAVLETIPSLHTVNTWASYHHERLDGRGYPFHVSAGELSLGSRVMAVADVFTAIAEDRPYRKGMDPEQALAVLDNMVRGGALDADVVASLKTHYGEIDALRTFAQAAALAEYRSFWEEALPVS